MMVLLLDTGLDEWAVKKLGKGRFEFECRAPGDDGWSRFGESPTIVGAIRNAMFMREGKPNG
jgi:hypothetical protein